MRRHPRRVWPQRRLCFYSSTYSGKFWPNRYPSPVIHYQPSAQRCELTSVLVRYGCFIDTNQFTVVSEIFPSHIRGQAVGIAMCGLFLADTLWLELQPTAQGAIGWKYYLVFACLGIVHMVFLYFFLPEVSHMVRTRFTLPLCLSHPTLRWTNSPRVACELTLSSSMTRHLASPSKRLISSSASRQLATLTNNWVLLKLPTYPQLQ